MDKAVIGLQSPTSVSEDRHRIRKIPRPRPILSCLNCRRKKLKCDRNSPCNQCIKSGRQSQCTFSNPQEKGERQEPAGGINEENEREVDEDDQGRHLRRRTTSQDRSDQPALHLAQSERQSEQPSPGTKPGIIESIQDRLETIEQQLKISKSRSFDSQSSVTALRMNPVFIKSRKSQSRCYGQGSRVEMLRHV